MKQYWISTIVVLLFCSCLDMDKVSESHRRAIIAEGVEIRVSEFRKNAWNKCLEEAQRKAVARADSIIRAMAREEAVEPIVRPPKPERPGKPPIKLLPDSIRVDTLLHQRGDD